MPQMSPMPWMLILILTLFFLFIVSSLIYFFFAPKSLNFTIVSSSLYSFSW